MIIEPPENLANGDGPRAEFDALRRLLVGPEQHRLDDLAEEVRGREVTAAELAAKLPDAIALRSSTDDRLGRALSPTIETALREAIRRNPRDVASAIFPVLGPAIRKAVAEALSGLVRSINTTIDQSLSVNGIKWRLEAWRTGVPYPEIVLKHALVYRVEQAFLVHAETGLLLLHVSAPDLKLPDADLISSMLSAIQDFVRDSFRPAEGAMLRTFSVGEHTVQVEAGPRALLALVIRGQAPDSVLRRQQDTLETIHLQFARRLADFSGDTAPFAPAQPLLEGCLATVLSTTRAEGSRRLEWVRWALPLLLIVAIAAGLWARSVLRWHRGLAALSAEPGLVITEASRGWRRWQISGLKDPGARSAAAVLAAAGVAAPALSGRWAAYLSLDPAMVARRERQAADSLKRAIEHERVLFAAGSADLDATAIAQLTMLMTRAERLAGARLEIIGRTDPSGADETNAALARRRVDGVAAWLGSHGIDPARLVPNPVAARDPLAAADSATRARINRSVTFRVGRPAPATSGGP